MTRLRCWFLLVAVALLPSCSPAYVLRAGYEEAKILWRRRPIDDLLARPDLDAPTRSKLELVLSLRTFAKRLGLRVGGSYRSFARVDADQIVHVVSAAERLRLQPYSWWFPIVGSLPYKGFFDAANARAEARALERRGFDTVVFPSVAFSTLGWFDDPLLSTLMRHDRTVLATIVLHELFHNTYYRSGQGAFNESFANFVGGRGAIAYFTANEGSAARSAHQAEMLWRDALTFSAFLDDFTAQLSAAYAAGLTLEERDAFFRRAQARFARLAFATDAHRDFGTMALNNAVILHEHLYYSQLTLFEAVYQRTGDIGLAIGHILSAVDGAPDPFAAVRAVVASGAPAEGRERAPAPAPGAVRTPAAPGATARDGWRARMSPHSAAPPPQTMRRPRSIASPSAMRRAAGS